MAASTLPVLFNSIPDFRYELMSMLCPSDLNNLLPILGYRLSEMERTWYITIDRQILKSTAFTDRMIKEGYSVVLLGNNFREIYEVMRGKKVGQSKWNTRTSADRYGYYPWSRAKVIIYATHYGDLEHNRIERTFTRNPVLLVPLPGTWEQAPYKLVPRRNSKDQF